MKRLDPEFIRNQVADDDLIYKRGERLFESRQGSIPIRKRESGSHCTRNPP